MVKKKCTECGYDGYHCDYKTCLICGLIYCQYCYKYMVFCLDDFNQRSNEDKKYIFDLDKKFDTLRKIMNIAAIFICFILVFAFYFYRFFFSSFFLAPTMIIFFLLIIFRHPKQLFFRKIIFKHLNKDIASKTFSKKYKKLKINANLNLTKGKLNDYKEEIKYFETKYGISFENFEINMKDTKYRSKIRIDYNKWRKYVRYSKDLENQIEKIEKRLNSIN